MKRIFIKPRAGLCFAIGALLPAPSAGQHAGAMGRESRVAIRISVSVMPRVAISPGPPAAHGGGEPRADMALASRSNAPALRYAIVEGDPGTAGATRLLLIVPD